MNPEAHFSVRPRDVAGPMPAMAISAIALRRRAGGCLEVVLKLF
jgi:hypothetical protein